MFTTLPELGFTHFGSVLQLIVGSVIILKEDTEIVFLWITSISHT